MTGTTNPQLTDVSDMAGRELHRAAARDAAPLGGRGPAGGHEEVASTWQELTDVLFLHLAEEERRVLPLAARHVTPAEWAELGQNGMSSMQKSDLPLLFGALIEDATPEEAREVYATVLPPVRLLLTTVFARKYRRYVRQVRG